MAESADASDLKSDDGNIVWVRPPLALPVNEKTPQGVFFRLCMLAGAETACPISDSIPGAPGCNRVVPLPPHLPESSGCTYTFLEQKFSLPTDNP